MKLNRFSVLVVTVSLAAACFGQTRFRSGLFLHHSTGNCIWGQYGAQVSVPTEITKYNLSHGLVGSDSMKITETWWPSTADNEWVTWHNIFDSKDASNDIRPFLTSYPVIMIKSCFPSSNMSGLGSSADTLNPTIKTVANYKWHWRSLVSVMKGRPQNFFIIWTNAPNVASQTYASEAALSDAFCRWAKDTLAAGLDPVVGAFPKNIFVFDFFHLLAGADGMLPLQLASSSSDSHPNAAATTLVAPQLVKQVFDAALAYESYMTVGIPAGVALSVPPDNATNQGTLPTLRWHSTAGATSYWLQIGINSTFASPLAVSDSTITDTTTAFHLSSDTKYYWHVRAKNASGTGEFSPTWSFTSTNFIPGEVALITPPNDASVSSDTVKCVWQTTSPSSSKHWFEVSTDSLFVASTSVDSTLTDTTKVVRALLENTPYYWRVRGGSAAGWGPFSERRAFVVMYTGIRDQHEISSTFVLNQNYPNPFNPSTTIRYGLPNRTHVTLAVFSTLGQQIDVLQNGEQDAGYHEVKFEGSGLPSGVYFYRIQAGNFVETRRLVLLR